MISFTQKGDFSKTDSFFKKVLSNPFNLVLDKYGKAGVAALSSATPKKTGKTANSWHYKIEKSKESIVISFHNTNIINNVPIAIILEYGHGTGTGGWVEGKHYISPAIQPVFDKLAKEAWEEVTKI